LQKEADVEHDRLDLYFVLRLAVRAAGEGRKKKRPWGAEHRVGFLRHLDSLYTGERNRRGKKGGEVADRRAGTGWSVLVVELVSPKKGGKKKLEKKGGGRGGERSLAGQLG